DQDLCNRMVRRGKRIYFEHTVVVYHYDRPLGCFAGQRLVWGSNVVPFFSRHSTLGNLYTFFPFAMLFFFLLGPAAARVFPSLTAAYLAVVSLYFGICLLEAIRLAPFALIPLTAVALVVGNLAPGLGTLLGLLGLKPSFERFYRQNDWRPLHE